MDWNHVHGYLREKEKDPLGTDPHKPGAKLDDGKLDLTLLPPALLEQVALVMMYGAQKYSRNGWKSVPDAAQRYYAALRRHLHAFEQGEDYDDDTGLHHLSHAACNLGFLLAFHEGGQDIGEWRNEKGTVDRPSSATDWKSRLDGISGAGTNQGSS